MSNYTTLGPPKMFTGGSLETNCYLLSCPEGNILVDAPDGSAAAFKNIPIALLVLTHGHFDHVWDAAEIVSNHGCRAAMHPITEQMLADRNLLRRFGLDLEVNPVKADIFLSEERSRVLLGHAFGFLEVPGHCPGSVCIYDGADQQEGNSPNPGNLYGGDVLFSGGVGRWDLPGGDKDLLFSGIRNKLFLLPDETTVYPGHGPSTKIGVEKLTNPFLLAD